MEEELERKVLKASIFGTNLNSSPVLEEGYEEESSFGQSMNIFHRILCTKQLCYKRKAKVNMKGEAYMSMPFRSMSAKGSEVSIAAVT